MTLDELQAECERLGIAITLQTYGPGWQCQIRRHGAPLLTRTSGTALRAVDMSLIEAATYISEDPLKCWECRGRGRFDGHQCRTEYCRRCNGTGRVEA